MTEPEKRAVKVFLPWPTDGRGKLIPKVSLFLPFIKVFLLLYPERSGVRPWLCLFMWNKNCCIQIVPAGPKAGPALLLPPQLGMWLLLQKSHHLHNHFPLF